MEDKILQINYKDFKFELLEGEIHAIFDIDDNFNEMLIKILSNDSLIEGSSVYFKGKKYEKNNREAILSSGISIVGETSALITNITIAEGFFVGREPISNKIGLINIKKIHEKAKKILSSFGFDVSVRNQISSLSILERRTFELIKAFYYNSDVIIMDNITSSLSAYETDKLLEMIKNLRDKRNFSVIYMTNNIPEVFKIAERVTIVDYTSNTILKKVSEITSKEITALMLNRDADDIFNRKYVDDGVVDMEVSGMDINFALKHGEILGVYCNTKSECSALCNTLISGNKNTNGEIKIGNSILPRVHSNYSEGNMAMLTSQAISIESKEYGVLFIKGNNLLSDVRQIIFKDKKSEFQESTLNKITKLFSFDFLKVNEDKKCRELIGKYREIASAFSTMKIKVIIFDDSVKNIEQASKDELFAIMNILTEQGFDFIVTSSDYDEIEGICDRVISK